MFDMQLDLVGLCSTKRCPRCGLQKMVSDFPFRDAKKLRRNSYCQTCQREYCQLHYRQHAREHNQRRLENNKRYVSQNRVSLRQYLEGQRCVDCGERDPIVLEFDHVQGAKVDDVSTMSFRAFSWRKLRAEIAKCMIRCANCHRRKTYHQRLFRCSFGR